MKFGLSLNHCNSPSLCSYNRSPKYILKDYVFFIGLFKKNSLYNSFIVLFKPRSFINYFIFETFQLKISFWSSIKGIVHLFEIILKIMGLKWSKKAIIIFNHYVYLMLMKIKYSFTIVYLIKDELI